MEALGSSYVDATVQHRSFANPPRGRPLPLHYGQLDPDQYRPTILQQPDNLGFMSDVISRTPSPAMHYPLDLDSGPGYASNFIQDHDYPFERNTSPPFATGTQYEPRDELAPEITSGTQVAWLPQPEADRDWTSLGAILSNEDAHDAYLRGKQDDWEIEGLDEGGKLDEWYNKTEEGLM